MLDIHPVAAGRFLGDIQFTGNIHVLQMENIENIQLPPRQYALALRREIVRNFLDIVRRAFQRGEHYATHLKTVIFNDILHQNHVLKAQLIHFFNNVIPQEKVLNADDQILVAMAGLQPGINTALAGYLVRIEDL